MSELRFNIISGEWTIIASERMKRPDEFKIIKQQESLPDYDKNCPFCLGNEGDLSVETFRIGDANTWKVRSIYNKYPALTIDKSHERVSDGLNTFVEGFGIHEVIVEHPRHNISIPFMPEEDIQNIIKMYQFRYNALSKIKGIEAVTIFKNQGVSAGASLKHPHSQIVATPIVHPMTRSRIENAVKYFDINGKCLFCRVLNNELNIKKRIIFETEKFVSFVPFAAAVPFIVWIFPRRHTASFGDIDVSEINDMAVILKDALMRLYHGLNNPDFNYTIRCIAVNENRNEYFHWYLSIVPRITQLAGFELGSGIFINTSIPEQCADFLKKVQV